MTKVMKMSALQLQMVTHMHTCKQTICKCNYDANNMHVSWTNSETQGIDVVLQLHEEKYDLAYLSTACTLPFLSFTTIPTNSPDHTHWWWIIWCFHLKVIEFCSIRERCFHVWNRPYSWVKAGTLPCGIDSVQQISWGVGGMSYSIVEPTLPIRGVVGTVTSDPHGTTTVYGALVRGRGGGRVSMELAGAVWW